MRLLDFVEQQHAMRMLVDAVGQQAALVEADIARRRADQARNRVALHIFRHVEAQQFDAERDWPAAWRLRSCRRRSGRRTGRSRSACSGSRRPARASLIADDSASIAWSCPKTTRFSSASRLASTVCVVLRHRLGRDARHRGDRRLDLLRRRSTSCAWSAGSSICARAGFVDHVDRLVGQLAVVDVARRQFHRRLDGVVGVLDLVEVLEIGLQALHDLDRIRRSSAR